MNTKRSEKWALDILALSSTQPEHLLKYIDQQDFDLNEDSWEAIHYLKSPNFKPQKDKFRQSLFLRNEIEYFAEKYFAPQALLAFMLTALLDWIIVVKVLLG